MKKITYLCSWFEESLFSLKLRTFLMAEIIYISSHGDNRDGGLDGLPGDEMVKKMMSNALEQALAEPTLNDAQALLMKSIIMISAAAVLPIELITYCSKKVTEIFKERNTPKAPQISITGDGNFVGSGTNSSNNKTDMEVEVKSPGTQVIQTQNNKEKPKE